MFGGDELRVCILSIVNIKHMSLISLYTDFLEKNNIEYDIIYIDKYQEFESIGAKSVYKYPISINRDWNFFKKLQKYYEFRKYATDILNNQKYDHIIVWRSETALLFFDYLLSKMKNKYSINIRDYCYEKIPFVYFIMKKLTTHSLFTTISSIGFKSFLPKGNYTLMHSYNGSILDTIQPRVNLNDKKDPIRICFIGYVRFYDQDIKLIDLLADNKKYIIQFFGVGSEKLKEYAKSKGYQNIETIPSFKVEETAKLLKKADVINNLYGHGQIALDTAVSIKYYYALKMNIPILVFNNTYMSEIVKENSTGYIVNNLNQDFSEDFWEWYHNLDFKSFKVRCENEMTRIKLQNKELYSVMENTFLQENYYENK